MGKKYIHYGSNFFDPSRFLEIKNCPMTKPVGGLWASPIECSFGWRDFAEKTTGLEHATFDESFEFELAENVNVLQIHSKKDLEGLPQLPDSMFLFRVSFWVYLDFEKLKQNGVDAIEYTHTAELSMLLYTWDCDSLLVLNPEVII